MYSQRNSTCCRLKSGVRRWTKKWKLNLGNWQIDVSIRLAMSKHLYFLLDFTEVDNKYFLCEMGFLIVMMWFGGLSWHLKWVSSNESLRATGLEHILEKPFRNVENTPTGKNYSCGKQCGSFLLPFPRLWEHNYGLNKILICQHINVCLMWLNWFRYSRWFFFCLFFWKRCVYPWVVYLSYPR